MPEKKKILIGEDERPLAKALSLKLVHAGFAADIATNGEEVLDMVGKGSYDLILLDLIMPKMDGFAVLEKLKQQKSTVPVIVTSNLSQPEDAERARELGAKDYLIKSNTALVTIVEYVEKLLK